MKFRFETDYSAMPVGVYNSSLVKTRIYKVHPAKVIYAGYHGNEYITKGGVVDSSEELIATVPGLISYEEEKEWEELLG